MRARLSPGGVDPIKLGAKTRTPSRSRGRASGVPHRVDAEGDSRLSGECQAKNEPVRAALYIDGFNLYHAVDELNENFLKWISYWKLGEIILPSSSEALNRVVYCTAYYPGDSQKTWRHEQFINAQKANGVSVVEGHYVREPMSCNSCGREWRKPTEKEGDINVALHLIKDAFEDRFDHAYLVSADSDQAATARLFRETFPAKSLTTVAPPGRNFSAHITKYTDGRRIALNRDHIERCVMPPVVFKPGVTSARRPREYEPPAWWVHPDARPRGPYKKAAKAD